MTTTADAALADAWMQLGGEPSAPARLTVSGPARTLASALPCTTAGIAAVGASLLAATGPGTPVGLDTRQLAVAVRSERYLRRDGASPGSPFDPLSAFHRAADRWIRLHANYPWHRAAALRVLGCADDLDAVRRAIADWDAVELETALHDAGGVAAACRTEAEWAEGEAGYSAGDPGAPGQDTPDHAHGRPAGAHARPGSAHARPSGAHTAADLPLVERRDLAPAPPRRPAGSLRVLDLTRVIAGPVATRTLAVHGADVLRVDPSDRPEIALQAWDMLPGKRSALADLADRDTREELLRGADVVVTGYRPGALDRFGLAPEALAQRHPGLTVVTLSAWGHRGPWAGRRGFDSLVQVACGIAVREAGPGWTGETPPGALPAQLLDHATGYLIAAGTLRAVADQRERGGTPHVRLSLLGTAQWLLGLPPETGPDPGEVDPDPYLQEIDAPDGRLTLAIPPGSVGGHPLRWGPPPPSFGTAAAAWPS
ncbi:MAG: CoA transferase [Pseudonocardia sp.]